MIFQALDDKEHCVGVYVDGQIHHTLPDNLTHTWSYAEFLADMEVTNANEICAPFWPVILEGSEDYAPSSLTEWQHICDAMFQGRTMSCNDFGMEFHPYTVVNHSVNAWQANLLEGFHATYGGGSFDCEPCSQEEFEDELENLRTQINELHGFPGLPAPYFVEGMTGGPTCIAEVTAVY